MFPKILGSIGLSWRKRADGRLIAIWSCRKDISRRGYPLKTQQVWAGQEAELTDTAKALIASSCRRLQDEMLGWARAGALEQPCFDGSVNSLIDFYRRDKDSPYQKVRYSSRKGYEYHLKAIEAHVGERQLSALRGKDFLRWYEAWGENDHTHRAHARITMFRGLLSFGIVSELYPSGIDHCIRLKHILSEMQFPQGAPRGEAPTAEQIIAIRKSAHTLGLASIALAQALQFELMLRQKDVIGAWVPIEEPGISAVTRHGKKWLYGLDWSEIDSNLILRHQMSKARKRKILEFDLKDYPMVMEELALIPQELRTGPVVKEGKLPWLQNATFGRAWRRCADHAKIPRTLQNRDSRAGGITEGNEAAGDNLDTVRHHAGHSDIRTTQRYSRGGMRRRSKLAVLRVAGRGKNETPTQ